MRMPRRTFSLAALCLAAAACAQVGDKAGEPQVPIVPANLIPPSPPLTAEEALRSFMVAPGYRIELVAEAPLVRHPTVLQFAPDGRLWFNEYGGALKVYDPKTKRVKLVAEMEIFKTQENGFLAGEIVPVVTEKFELEGYKARGIKLQGKVTEVSTDTHARISPIEVLAKLKPVYEGGVQTGGNSSALVDAAAACVVTSGTYAKANGKKPLARVVAAAAVGVPPEIMGIGPAPAIRLLLERTGLKLSDIGRFEINEAQGAQTLAVGRELGLDLAKLNVNGGAIALGHPLAATGVRLTITLARELKRSGLRYGISSACVGGGQGIALLIENPDGT